MGSKTYAIVVVSPKSRRIFNFGSDKTLLEEAKQEVRAMVAQHILDTEKIINPKFAKEGEEVKGQTYFALDSEGKILSGSAGDITEITSQVDKVDNAQETTAYWIGGDGKVNSGEIENFIEWLEKQANPRSFVPASSTVSIGTAAVALLWKGISWNFSYKVSIIFGG